MLPQPKFVITGLPRSRTAWLGALLATPAVPVYHDLRTYPPTGTHYGVSDPMLAATPDGDSIPAGTPCVFMFRPPQEAKAALERAYGVELDTKIWSAMVDRSNDFISKHRPLVVMLPGLQDSGVLQVISRHLTGKPLDQRRIDTFQALKITQHSTKALAAYPELRLVDQPRAATSGPAEAG